MKRLAMNINGDMTYCSCPPGEEGRGRCNHIAHQEKNESPADFCKRVERIQKRMAESKENESKGLTGDEAVDRLLTAMYGDQSSDDPFGAQSWIPYEGTEVELKPYRMTDDEKAGLFKIENRMQLDQNIDGGYMELEEPLWNDMDKNYFCQQYGMNKKSLNMVLHGEASIILNEGSGRYTMGRVVSNDVLAQWEKEGYPRGWDPDAIELGTGVLAMNQYAKEMGFEATKDVYVLPYYMRRGMNEHNNYTTSAGTGSDDVEGYRPEVIPSDITLAYKYMLRNHANPDRQQLAYEALLDNSSLDKDKARYNNGYRNKSLADEFAGKGGVFRAVLSGNSIPYNGRAVLTPNADLEFGEVAIPPSMAIDIFRPTLIQQFSSEGWSEQTIDGYMSSCRVPQTEVDPYIREDLEKRIGHLRVSMNRQPSLHQSSFQSFRPRISNNASVQGHPLYCKAYNSDHDGDTVVIHAYNTDYHDQDLVEVLDRSIDSSLPVNTRLPRHHDTLSIMPNKDAMFGLLSILEQRSN